MLITLNVFTFNYGKVISKSEELLSDSASISSSIINETTSSILTTTTEITEKEKRAYYPKFNIVEPGFPCDDYTKVKVLFPF